MVRRCIESKELGRRGSCHLSRHTMATLMVEGGADIRIVQQILGHAKLETTELYHAPPDPARHAGPQRRPSGGEARAAEEDTRGLSGATPLRHECYNGGVLMPRVYVDTSVFGGCFDPEWSEWSNRLMDEFPAGRKLAVLSNLTLAELEGAPERVSERVEQLPASSKPLVSFDEEALELAERYIEESALTPKMRLDAQHIATASVQRLDVRVSWDFRHIANLNRIRIFNAVNLMAGSSMLEIRSPREVLDEQ
jgi:hypothetical protein